MVLGFNGAETNCGIAHILGILRMNSYNTDIFLATTIICSLPTLNCIVHQAFLSTEHVFLIHTRHHFKLTRKAFLPKLHHLIGHFCHSNHRQQKEHGTQACRRFRITSWHCQQMLKSATDAVTCSQKNFVRHHTNAWSSMWIGMWYAGTTTQGR